MIRNSLHYTATMMTTKMKNDKDEKRKLPIIVRLVYRMNILMGTAPIFRINNKKIKVDCKNIRKLYFALLLVVTIFCVRCNKDAVSNFSNLQNDFNIRHILMIIATMSTILSAIVCWIVSFTLSKYYKKIIYNNIKINKLLKVNYKKKRIPLLNETMCIFIVYMIVNFVLAIYVSFEYLKESDSTDVWFHILIFLNDWFIITYLMQQKLNIYNMKLINTALKDMLNVNRPSSLNIDKIMLIFVKLHENNVSSKYIMSFPVNIIYTQYNIQIH